MKKNKSNPNYKSKNHSKYLLTYHFIFVCKYRQKLLIKYDFVIKEMEVDKDHIHLMIESEPKVSPLMIVRVLKQQSTKRIWGDYNSQMKKYFWHENTFWTDGYFVSTIGEVSSKTLKHYIENQG